MITRERRCWKTHLLHPKRSQCSPFKRNKHCPDKAPSPQTWHRLRLYLSNVPQNEQLPFYQFNTILCIFWFGDSHGDSLFVLHTALLRNAPFLLLSVRGSTVRFMTNADSTVKIEKLQNRCRVFYDALHEERSGVERNAHQPTGICSRDVLHSGVIRVRLSTSVVYEITFQWCITWNESKQLVFFWSFANTFYVY